MRQYCFYRVIERKSIAFCCSQKIMYQMHGFCNGFYFFKEILMIYNALVFDYKEKNKENSGI